MGQKREHRRFCPMRTISHAVLRAAVLEGCSVSRPEDLARRRVAIATVFCTSLTVGIAHAISPMSRLSLLCGTLPESVTRPPSQRTSTSCVPVSSSSAP